MQVYGLDLNVGDLYKNGDTLWMVKTIDPEGRSVVFRTVIEPAIDLTLSMYSMANLIWDKFFVFVPSYVPSFTHIGEPR